MLTSTAAARVRAVGTSVTTYIRLTKPRVIELLLVTTVPAMVMAAGRLPSVALILAVLVGGALTAGGANAINCWIERDRDRIMHRTRRRPLPSGDIRPRNAFVFALALEIGGFVTLWATANLLAGLLALAAALFYIFVYTLWLKPRTTQNIVVGGAAGAVPVLVGWAAVTGRLDLAAWVMFAIVFFWTPPHFWALSMRYRHDYAAAGIPMLPVARGLEATARQIVIYSLVLTVVTLALVPFDRLGALYFGVALGLGATFVWRALALQRDPTPARGLQLFSFSNAYLALVFGAIALDTLLPPG
ncbi:MAG: heme o synthase [Acidimicrobiia bacterium]